MCFVPTESTRYLMGELTSKGAVVTGGSRGIGRSVVKRLARDGARVLFNYASRSDQAKEVEDAVRNQGGEARGAQIDLSAPNAIEELMRAAEQYLDGLDILVNNAALEFAVAPIADTDETTWDAAMNVNAKAAFLSVRHAARTMRDEGRIINISTANTSRPAPGNAPYVASKGAIEQLTKVAAIELGVRGITVNALCPGATDTDLLRSTNTEAALQRVAALTPLRRLGQPADVADVVSFLASPDARWLTGQIINATGGLA